MDAREETKNDVLQQRINILITILLVLAVSLCFYAAVQVMSNGYVNLGGFMMFRVVTGSMEPTIPVGGLLLARQVKIESIQLHDIVCFRTQASQILGKIVTHRVVGIEQTQFGTVLLETMGDANLVSDGHYVDQTNLIGKVIWHTKNGSILAGVVSLFTSKIGFLGCIVFPCLLLAAMILKDSVVSIRKDLRTLVEESRKQQKKNWAYDPLCGMTQEEYDEMYERIRAELMEELKHLVETQQEQETSS